MYSFRCSSDALIRANTDEIRMYLLCIALLAARVGRCCLPYLPSSPSRSSSASSSSLESGSRVGTLVSAGSVPRGILEPAARCWPWHCCIESCRRSLTRAALLPARRHHEEDVPVGQRLFRGLAVAAWRTRCAATCSCRRIGSSSSWAWSCARALAPCASACCAFSDSLWQAPTS